MSIVVALDMDSAEEALALARALDPQRCRLKIGKNLFCRAGGAILEALHGMGYAVFLDLKFHDIPNTVAAAVRAAADWGVWMVNIHASGGMAMMRAAKEALQGYENPPLLIAVTVLTSMDEATLRDVGVQRDLQAQVLHLARQAQAAGLDGVVCSAQESALLRQELGRNFRLVTPGIRPTWAAANDQHRIITPAEALRLGSDDLVIGRPITTAANPLQALKRIEEEIEVARARS